MYANTKTIGERFTTAIDEGDVTAKGGYHKPRQSGCGCSKTTKKGAYRDVTVEMPDGRVIHYYHQTAVVVEHPDGRVEANSGGYRTSTTKERINRYLPPGYHVVQRDWTWYLKHDGERVEFEDGMEIDA